MSFLLDRCTSIKVKRLFLALVARHRHAWFAQLKLHGVDLGKGKRALYPDGQLDPSSRPI